MTSQTLDAGNGHRSIATRNSSILLPVTLAMRRSEMAARDHHFHHALLHLAIEPLY